MTYYDEISKGYAELHGEEQLKKAKIIASKIKVKPHESLLDVGCGPAYYLDFFDCKVTGIDPSQELISKYQGKHRVMLGNAENLPFNDHSFDFVISLTAIHNFENPEQGLHEMKRVGKNVFAFSVLKKSPKFESIQKLIDNIFTITEQLEEDKDIIFLCN